MNEKPVYQSKTIWGAVALLGAVALSKYNVFVDAAEIEANISNALGVVGFVLTVWGRFTATRTLKIFG